MRKETGSMTASAWSIGTLWKVLGGIVGVCLVIGQPARAHARMLGLEQLIQMALERSPELKKANQGIAAALSDVDQATAAQWAQIDLIGVGGMIDDAKQPIVKVAPTPGPDGFLRGRIEANEQANGYGPFGRLEFTIFQPLLTFGKIGHRRNAALDAVAVQRAAKEKTRGEVILKVKELYFALLLARQGREAATEVETFVEDARQRMQRLLTLGSTNVDEGDLYRLESYAAESKRFRARAEAGANLAAFALKQWIGLATVEALELDVKELPKDTRALGEQQEYVAKALQTRPEFEQLDKGLEARRSLVEAAKSDLYPSFFALGVGSLAAAPGREHLDEPYIEDEFNRARAGVVLGAKWHFDFGILQGKVSKAQAEYQQLVHTREMASLNIPIEVVKHYQEAFENLQAFQALEQAAGAARKWVVVTFSNFDIGVGQARDIFFAVERYGRNRGDYLEALLKYHLALARLSYAVGEYRSKVE
jgi:outer membrane protein